MSMARLVITAVSVESRSKSEIARDYGISRVWCRNWSNALKRRVRPRIGHARVGPMPTPGRSAWRLRIRSCGSPKPSLNEASTHPKCNDVPRHLLTVSRDITGWSRGDSNP
jgi:hypothetical protein